MKKIIHVVGARPNFMKAAPAIAALARSPGIIQKIVHSGQHYDKNMSEVFFEQLGIPHPDINLEVGSGSHATMTAQIMMKFEEVVLREKPDLTLVYGDINSTVAASLVATKLGVKVGHVEAGLRSHDRSMPEELNRLVTDQLSDYLFTPSPDGNDNLQKEGIPPEKIFHVGNLMIDTLVRLLPEAELLSPGVQKRYGVTGNRYILVTLHRPSNVDEPEMLEKILWTLSSLASEIPVLFPIHPRTRRKIIDHALPTTGLLLAEPLGYLEFLALQKKATVVVTDSGGIQEETTYLGVPCLTVRENTERPITVDIGTNILVGRDMERLTAETRRILGGDGKRGRIPELWDGRAGNRVADIVERFGACEKR